MKESDSNTKRAVPIPPDPGTKVRVLQNSRLSFVLSLFGLLPVIGLPFAIRALILARRARVNPDSWPNPGRYHVKAAHVISWLGLFISLISIFVLPGIGRSLTGGGGGGGGG